jgi:hypothetical protein
MALMGESELKRHASAVGLLWSEDGSTWHALPERGGEGELGGAAELEVTGERGDERERWGAPGAISEGDAEDTETRVVVGGVQAPKGNLQGEAGENPQEEAQP